MNKQTITNGTLDQDIGREVQLMSGALPRTSHESCRGRDARTRRISGRKQNSKSEAFEAAALE
jgi:hypothetical protein